MRILFMGTPEFAAVHLSALTDEGYDVVGAVCQPDKPKGRKKELTPPPVKVTALDNNIPVFQPETLKGGEGEKLLKQLNPDLVAVVAYGKLLPEDVLDFPKYGCINVHGSILPKYRGAAPVQRAIIDGLKETGVTVMYMDKGLDTGDIILTKPCPIYDGDNQDALFERMAPIGCEALIEAIEKIKDGTATRTPQNDAHSTYAAMLSKADGKIDWEKSSDEIYNLVRGTNPWPCAHSTYGEKTFKVLTCQKTDGTGAPGEVLFADDKNGLVVACGDGALRLLTIQFEGSAKMDARDYLRGHKIPVSEILGR